MGGRKVLPYPAAAAPNRAVGEEETAVPAVELGTAPPGESGGGSSGENNGGGG